MKWIECFSVALLAASLRWTPAEGENTSPSARGRWRVGQSNSKREEGASAGVTSPGGGIAQPTETEASSPFNVRRGEGWPDWPGLASQTPLDEGAPNRESLAGLTTFTEATDGATFTRGRAGDTLRRGASRPYSSNWFTDDSFHAGIRPESISGSDAEDLVGIENSQAFDSDASTESLEVLNPPPPPPPPIDRRRRKGNFSVKVFSAAALAPLVILLGLMVVEKMHELRPRKRQVSDEEVESQLRRDQELGQAIARLPPRVSLEEIQKQLEKAFAPRGVAEDISNALAAMHSKDRAWESTSRGSALMQVLESFFDHVNETQVARRFIVRGLSPVGTPTRTGAAPADSQEVELEWRRILKVTPGGVFLEVVATNKTSRQLIGERPLSMLVLMGQVIDSECRDEASCQRASERTYAFLQRDREQRLRCFRRDIFRTPQEAMRKFGVAVPTHTGRVGPASVPFVVVEGESRRVICSDVILGPLCYGSVEDMLKTRHRLSTDSREFLASMLLREVAALNAKGVCHNGLALDAVLLDTRGVPVLYDLRLARRLGEERKPQPPWLLSPEEADAFQRKASIVITPQLDSWALGVALYQLFADESPFEDVGNGGLLEEVRDSETAKTAVALMREMCPSVRLRELGVPDLWTDIIAMLLQPNPEDRPTAAQVLSYYHTI